MPLTVQKAPNIVFVCVIDGFLTVTAAQMIFTLSDLSFAADKGHSL